MYHATLIGVGLAGSEAPTNLVITCQANDPHQRQTHPTKSVSGGVVCNRNEATQ